MTYSPFKKKAAMVQKYSVGGILPEFFLVFSYPCSADHERDWLPVPGSVFRVGNTYAECEKQLHGD